MNWFGRWEESLFTITITCIWDLIFLHILRGGGVLLASLGGLSPTHHLVGNHKGVTAYMEFLSAFSTRQDPTKGVQWLQNP